MAEGYQALTAKDAAALRLLLSGHDAKSMANQLGLSVHTINERLRDARRKLSVSSSKAAARHPLPGGERREAARSGCDLRRGPARASERAARIGGRGGLPFVAALATLHRQGAAIRGMR